MSGSGGGHWEQDQHKLAPRPMAYLTQDPRETPRRQTRPDPPLPRPTQRRPHHRRPAHPPRSGDRGHHRRCPQPTDGPQTHDLDPGRPRLRNPAHRPANPLHPPRHHHNPGSSGIDNTLSIGISQVSRLTAASPGRVARARGDQAAAGERNEVVQNAPPDGDHK